MDSLTDCIGLYIVFFNLFLYSNDILYYTISTNQPHSNGAQDGILNHSSTKRPSDNLLPQATWQDNRKEYKQALSSQTSRTTHGHQPLINGA